MITSSFVSFDMIHSRAAARVKYAGAPSRAAKPRANMLSVGDAGIRSSSVRSCVAA